MISAKDLRIGNYIISGNNGKFDPEGTIGKVLEIGNEDREFEQIYCECEESFEWFWKDNYFGIPLTESELEKLGVIKQYQENPFEEGSKWNKWFDEGNYTLNEDGSRWYSWVKGAFNLEIDKDGKIMFEVYSHYIPLDYVHQFQNLYYLLTNEELIYIK